MKRLRGGFSVSLFLAGELGVALLAGLRRADAALTRAIARLVAGRPGRPDRPATAAVPPTATATATARAAPSRRARLASHGALAALVGLAVLPQASEPFLHLATRPIAGWQPLNEPATIVAPDGTSLARVQDVTTRRPIPLSEVPEVLVKAVVAAEDQRFWSHGGYDSEAVGRALLANVRAREVTQGASTITQQLAKLNYVGDDPTFVRKGKELLHAVALEERYTKEQLLERYLNQVSFGAQADGVASASEELFGKPVHALSVDQAALLAGLIRAPSALDPRTRPEAATARRNDVLRAMVGTGALSATDAEAAASAPLGVVPSRPATVTEPFVVEAVKREFLANPAFGPTEDARRRLLQTGGLQIRTTVDLGLQAAARVATRWVPASLGSALVAVDPATGRVLALHNGGAAASGHFDVALQGARQPGSTFKPLVAAAALEAGMPEWQVLAGNGPIELDYADMPKPWRVDNFDAADYGLVDLREAVVDSVNTAFAQLGVALGADRIATMAERLGIDVERAMGPPSSRGPSMALGGLTHGVSPLQLASAYGTFAAGGNHVRPYVIDSVVRPDGSELYRAQPKPRPALDKAITAVMVDILEEAVEDGTGAAAALGDWNVIGKTGTSEGSADGWFVGAVPVLSAAVWVGRPDSEQPIPGLTGGTMAAPIWRIFMTEVLRGHQPVDFDTAAPRRPNVSPLPLPTARVLA